jgi:outer membrane protein assembly factor BamB
VTAFATLALTAVLAVPVPGWSQPGFDATNSGYNPAETIVNATTINRLQRRWHVTPEPGAEGCESGVAPPLAAGGRMFTLEGEGVSAYHAGTGARLWHNAAVLDSDAGRRITLVGDLLIATGTSCYSHSDPDGYLTALDVRTGEVRWHTWQEAPIVDVVADAGTVVTSGWSTVSNPAAVTAYRVTDGARLWSREDVQLTTEVSAAGRIVLTADWGTSVVSIGTGAVQWYPRTSWIPLAATPAGDQFLVATPAGTLAAIHATTGRTLWAARGAAGPLATDGRRVFVARAGQLSAYNAAGGRRLWSVRAPGAGRPIRAGGLLYATMSGRPLAILSPVTGAVMASGRPYRTAIGSVVVAGGRLYTTDGRTIRAYAR